MPETMPLSHASRGEPDLSHVLRFDAFTCCAMGLLLVAAANPLAGLLGLPAALLFWAGVVLFPCALLMFLAAGRPRFAAFVWLIVLGNVAWVVASALVVFALDTTAIGLAFVAAQAVVVAVLAWLEWRGARST